MVMMVMMAVVMPVEVPLPRRPGKDPARAIVGPGGLGSPIKSAAGITAAGGECRSGSCGDNTERERHTSQDTEELCTHDAVLPMDKCDEELRWQEKVP